jgi:serine/threonine-protein kinase
VNEQTLFAEALERTDPQDRAAFLDQACQGDPDLRQRIERLLAQHQHAGSFLELSPARAAPTIDEPTTEGPGAVIGPYKLMEQIGEGGMGLVFVAEQQQPVRRKVALKVIKPGMDTRQVVARFEAERQALALMDHPNIAKVLDGGETTSGRPYFVMDLVKGVPITEFCDQNQVPVRERLELFLHVCQAVQHAHQKGIIHRDIKPSNVLVMSHDGTPLVKVIDFGVAKAIGQQLTDKTIYTQFSQMVGTPLYMSPEQAGQSGLDVDTRSDIYSLGVLLYELLTGTTPFDKERLKEAGYEEIRRIIREEEPVKPSTRISTLGKAAATVSTNRKSEPRQLSRLFRGELDWIVMKALEKDRDRRYETANAFAADVQRYLADEPVLACPPSAWYRVRKFARRNRRPLAAAAVLGLALLVAVGSVAWAVGDREARWAKLTGEVESILQDVDRLEGEQKWPEALAAAERAEAAMAGGEADDAMRERLGARRRELAFVVRLERIREDRVGEGEGIFNLAGATRDYAEAFRDYYGVDLEALPPAEAAARLGAKPVLAVPVAAALDDWADTRRALGEAESRWKRLVALARGLDTDPVRDQLRALWGDPMTPDWQTKLLGLGKSLDAKAVKPATLVALALALVRAKLTEPALQILQEGQYAYPNDFWLNFTLGNRLYDRKDYAGALRYYTAAVSLRPNSPAAHLNLGNALKDLRKLDEAIACYKRAIEIAPKDYAAYSNLGAALSHQGKLDQAIVEFRKAIDLCPDVAAAHNNLGAALRDKMQLDDAERELRMAIQLDPEFAVAHSNLGDVLRKKQPNEAIREYRIAIRLDPKDGMPHAGLGLALSDMGQRDEAIREYRIAINLGFKTANTYDKLGTALARQGKLEEAITEFRTAIDLDPKYALVHYNLGTALFNQGKLDEAIVELRQAIALGYEEAEVHCNLGNALRQRGEFQEALKELRHGHELGTRRPGGWRYPTAQLIQQCERLVELDTRLPALLAGQSKPASAAEQIELAVVCGLKRLHRAAVRFYAEAFDMAPKLAEELDSFRYYAASSAALAACGQDRDPTGLDDTERARLRKRALAWLEAELQGWQRWLDQKADVARPAAARMLQRWLADPNFAGLRGCEALARLPEADRQHWQRLWNDVSAVLNRAQGKTASEK